MPDITALTRISISVGSCDDNQSIFILIDWKTIQVRLVIVAILITYLQQNRYFTFRRGIQCATLSIYSWPTSVHLFWQFPSFLKYYYFSVGGKRNQNFSIDIACFFILKNQTIIVSLSNFRSWCFSLKYISAVVMQLLLTDDDC